MIKIMKKKFLQAAAIVLAAGVFFGCETDITGSIENSGRAVLNVDSVFMKNTSTLIKKLIFTSDETVDIPIIDANELNKSFTSGGIEKAAFKNVAGNTAALSGEITISKIDGLIKDRGLSLPLVKFEKKSGASGGSVTFYIDRENGPGVLEAISPELVGYLQLLMAPIAEGIETDITDKKNYLENITMVWGAPVAKEINSSYITLNLKFPQAVTTIRGSFGKSVGKADGNKAVIKIPLIDLLVLEAPVFYEIIWGK
jgi:hypothetical protein